MCKVYILFSEKFDRYYIGSTENLDKRIRYHNAGYNRSTKAYRPWSLIHVETCGSKTEARKREMQIKSYKRGRAFYKLMERGVGTEAVKRGRL